MANAAGIENSYTVTSPEEFESETRASMQRKGPSYIVAKVEAAGTNADRWSKGTRIMGIVAGGAHAEFVTAHQDAVAAVPANLGVNPSLTITAMAERAMSLWPNKGDEDPRPAPGTKYERLAPIPPQRPAVPAHAPGALQM